MRLVRFNSDWRPDVGDLDFVIEVQHLRSKEDAMKLNNALRNTVELFLGNNDSKRRGW